MKQKIVFHAAVSLVCAALSICGCSTSEWTGTGRRAAVRLYVEEEEGCSRSAASLQDNGFPDDITIFIYDSGGVLVKTISPDRRLTESDNTIYVDNIVTGRDYYLCALAGISLNDSDLERFGTLSGAAGYTISYTDFIEGGRMIYSSIPEEPVRIEKGHNYKVGLRRIAAKYHFVIDQSEMEGNFTATSLTVRQSPAMTHPFALECRTDNVWEAMDGDCADAGDIAALNAGAAAHFYIFENLQGNALAGNTDPWEKVPGRLESSLGGMVTYVEISGSYRNTGISIDRVVYRFILGEDNLCNCDVRRNTVQTVTLMLSDENTILKESWKVTRGEVIDLRRTAFGADTLKVFPFPGRSDTVRLDVEPEDLRYSVSLDSSILDEYPFEVSVSDGNVIVNSVRFLDGNNTTACFPIYIATRDRLVGDTLTVAYHSLDRIQILLPHQLYYNFEGYVRNGEDDVILLAPRTADTRSDASSCLRVSLNYNGIRKTTTDTLYERGLRISSSRSTVVSSALSGTNPTLWYLTARSAGSARLTASYEMDGITKSGSLNISPLQLSMELSATGTINAGQSCRPSILLHDNDGELFPVEECVGLSSSDTGILSDDGYGISAGTADLVAKYYGLRDEYTLSDSKRITVRPLIHTLSISTSQTRYYLSEDGTGDAITVLYDGTPVSTGIGWNIGNGAVIGGVTQLRPSFCGPGTSTLSASYAGLTSNTLNYEVRSSITSVRLKVTSLTIQEGISAPTTWSGDYIPGSLLQVGKQTYAYGESGTWLSIRGGTGTETTATLTIALYADIEGLGETLLTTKTFSVSVMRDDRIDFTAEDWEGFVDRKYFDFTASIIGF